MLNETMPQNNMKVELETTILTEKLVNDRSLLQLVQMPDDKILLRCRYISAETGCIDEDIIHEFSSENDSPYQVLLTEKNAIVFNKNTHNVEKLYDMDYHYMQNEGWSCEWTYEKLARKETEAILFEVEKESTKFTLTKTILPKINS